MQEMTNISAQGHRRFKYDNGLNQQESARNTNTTGSMKAAKPHMKKVAWASRAPSGPIQLWAGWLGGLRMLGKSNRSNDTWATNSSSAAARNMTPKISFRLCVDSESVD